MMRTKNFMYDEFSDRLMVFNDGDNEKVKENYIFGDFIISLTERGKVIGLEIIGVSNILKECGIDARILDNIKNTELHANLRRDTICIFLNVQIPLVYDE